MVLVCVLMVLLVVSCNTYQKCPAYTEVQTEPVENASV